MTVTLCDNCEKIIDNGDYKIKGMLGVMNKEGSTIDRNGELIRIFEVYCSMDCLLHKIEKRFGGFHREMRDLLRHRGALSS